MRMLQIPDVALFVHSCRSIHRHRRVGFQCRDSRVGEVASLRATGRIVSQVRGRSVHLEPSRAACAAKPIHRYASLRRRCVSLFGSTCVDERATSRCPRIRNCYLLRHFIFRSRAIGLEGPSAMGMKRRVLVRSWPIAWFRYYATISQLSGHSGH